MRAVAISPHLDDAAFSCGGTLARLAALGWQVTICTVFTLSVPNPGRFAIACQLDKGLPPDVDYMALRRQEDLRACLRLNCEPRWLPLPEAPHRGYDNAKALFGPLSAGDDVAARLDTALAHLLDPRPDLILAPQAVGGHVDHVQVHQAVQRVLPRGVPVYWWLDFPYALRPETHPARPFAQVMDALTGHVIQGDLDARIAACRAYETQIGFQFGGAEKLEQALRAAGPGEAMRLQGDDAVLAGLLH
jgi:LmbE family N-acetylglucosaminyl deacetylase